MKMKLAPIHISVQFMNILLYSNRSCGSALYVKEFLGREFKPGRCFLWAKMGRETCYEFIDYKSNSFANKIHRLTYRLTKRYSDKKEENYLKLIFRLREDRTKKLKTLFG